MKFQKIDKTHIALAVFLLVQIVYMTWNVAYRKVELHSDEQWQYGLANSYYRMNIFSDQERRIENFYEWESSEVFRNYLTVQENQRFSYDSLWDNSRADMHPPLYMAVLHTICSLFPNQFSIWYAFSINLVCFLIAQIYLFRLVRLWTKNALAALVSVVLYGFSLAGLNTYYFLRLYAMASAFSTVMVYYTAKLYQCKEKSLKDNVRLFVGFGISLLLAGLSSHMALMFAFFVVAGMSVYYLFSRRFQMLFAYGFTALAAVGAEFAVFPYALTHLFHSYGSSNVSFDMNYRMLRSVMMMNMFGIPTKTYATMTATYAAYALGILVFLAVPFCFICRKEVWFLTFVRKSKVVAVRTLQNCNWCAVMILLGCVAHFFATAYKGKIYEMSIYGDRYIYVMYAAVYAVVISALYVFIRFVVRKERLVRVILSGIVLVSLLAAHLMWHPVCLGIAPPERFEVADIAEDADFILVMKQYWLLTNYASALQKSHSYIALTNTDYANYLEEVEKNVSDRPLYLIYQTPSDLSQMSASVMYEGDADEYSAKVKEQKILDAFRGLKITKRFEEIGTTTFFYRECKIVRLR